MGRCNYICTARVTEWQTRICNWNQDTEDQIERWNESVCRNRLEVTENIRYREVGNVWKGLCSAADRQWLTMMISTLILTFRSPLHVVYLYSLALLASLLFFRFFFLWGHSSSLLLVLAFSLRIRYLPWSTGFFHFIIMLYEVNKRPIHAGKFH